MGIVSLTSVQIGNLKADVSAFTQYHSPWVTCRISGGSFGTDFMECALSMLPGDAVALASALIAAARASGWVQPAVEVVREVEALDA